MSEVLGRTWAFLTASGSGPRWTVPSHQSSPSSHLPHGLAQFIKAAFDAPTADSEADVIAKQLQVVEAKLKEPQLRTSVLADCVVRALICHLASESCASFAHIHALQLAQKGSITEKKIGYLACCLMLKEDDDLLLLLINTIIRDLKSDNAVEINMALVAATYLTPREMVPMIFPIVLQRTNHSKVRV